MQEDITTKREDSKDQRLHKMSGRRTRKQPTQVSTPSSEEPEAKVVPPLDPRLETCDNLVNIPTNPIPQIPEGFGRDKDLKTLLKSLQPKNFSGEEDNVSNTLEEWII